MLRAVADSDGPPRPYVPIAYPKYLYHPKLAPQGRLFQTEEETKGLGRGWVDTPNKFPKPSPKVEAFREWWGRSEWSVRALAALLALAAAAVALFKALMW